MLRPTFLEYRGYRFLKAASLCAVAAALVYWATKPPGGVAYGGTWLGYLLGIASLLTVLILMWYGIRKRRIPRVADRRQGPRRKRLESAVGVDATRKRQADRRKTRAADTWRYGSTLQGWLSAHVYLGILLIVLSSLHAGFRFGWNVHTLAYLLMVLVVASGGYGVFAYLRYPRLITSNIGEDSLSDLLLRIAELDELARVRALGLPNEVNALVAAARHGTRVGGNLFQQLSGRQRACPTALAVQSVHESGKKLADGDQPKRVTDLYSVLLQKQRLVAKARQEISFNARMQCWLYLHAPLSIALLAALFVHVAAVLVYW